MDCLNCDGYGEVCDECGDSEEICLGCTDDDGEEASFSECSVCEGSGESN